MILNIGVQIITRYHLITAPALNSRTAQYNKSTDSALLYSYTYYISWVLLLKQLAKICLEVYRVSGMHLGANPWSHYDVEPPSFAASVVSKLMLAVHSCSLHCFCSFLLILSSSSGGFQALSLVVISAKQQFHF